MLAEDGLEEERVVVEDVVPEKVLETLGLWEAPGGAEYAV